jgi:DNA-binding MarR family transcriptional regulator
MTKENIAELARDLGRAMTEMRNFLRQHIFVKIRDHEVDITFELLEVLSLLHRKDGSNQQEIADVMVKDKSSMTYLINTLAMRGMVTRREDENDGRNKLIYLTGDGKLLLKKLDPWINEMYKSATRGINATDIKKAILLIHNMNKNLKK